MKLNLRTRGLLIIGGVISAVSLWWGTGGTSLRTAQAAEGSLKRPDQDTTTLQAEVNRLKGLVPDQSHAMKDVGYHFANLWFAGQKANWPLADFYWAETRSHLRWAVRIIPVRKDPQGNEIRLQEILDPIEKSSLEEIHNAINAKSTEEFSTAYRQMIESCYSCHLASGKPFLKLHVPSQPEAPIINFEP